MTIVTFVSDTHEWHHLVHIPKCDVLVHCGDATGIGEVHKLQQLDSWARRLKLDGRAKEVIFVPGNHEVTLDVTHPYNARSPRHERVSHKAREVLENVHVLLGTGIELCGLKFWGSPMAAQFGEWAFMFLPEEAEATWAGIPSGLDVLITHGPPFGILDGGLGCPVLQRRVGEVAPRVHAFGHIHGFNGEVTIGPTTYINAAICDDQNIPKFQARTIQL